MCLSVCFCMCACVCDCLVVLGRNVRVGLYVSAFGCLRVCASGGLAVCLYVWLFVRLGC